LVFKIRNVTGNIHENLLQTVKRNKEQYQLPLKVVSYQVMLRGNKVLKSIVMVFNQKRFFSSKLIFESFIFKELYGWTMDDIVKQIGLKNNCKTM
jgi:cytoplasmic tRNA 2-thiolation protein 1